jgi:hypothetical protein
VQSVTVKGLIDDPTTQTTYVDVLIDNIDPTLLAKRLQVYEQARLPYSGSATLEEIVAALPAQYPGATIYASESERDAAVKQLLVANGFVEQADDGTLQPSALSRAIDTVEFGPDGLAVPWT